MNVLRTAGFVLTLVALGGCGNGDPGTSSTPGSGGTPVVLPGTGSSPTTTQAAQFRGHFDAKTRKMTFSPVARNAGDKSAQGFMLDSSNLFTLGSVDGDFGGVSGGPCPSDSSTTFCTNVQTTNTSASTVDDVYVEITSLDLGDVANPDTPGAGYSPPLSGSFGQFYYGSLAGGGTGTKLWKFDDPGQADFNFVIDVLYTLRRSSYTHIGPIAGPSVDACASGNVLVSANGDTDACYQFATAFPFTIYEQTEGSGIGNATVGQHNLAQACENGTLQFGGADKNGTDKNEALPSGIFDAVDPAIAVFWTPLKRSSSKICEQSAGTSPNRTHTITWSNLLVTGTTDHVTFSAVLHEGSDQVDLIYAAPTALDNFSEGLGATAGIQGPISGVATAHQIAPGDGSTTFLPTTAGGYPAMYTLTAHLRPHVRTPVRLIEPRLMEPRSS